MPLGLIIDLVLKSFSSTGAEEKPGSLNGYMVHPLSFRHPLLYATGFCFPGLQAMHFCSAIVFLEFFGGYKILIQDFNGGFTIQYLVADIQEMKILVPDLYMLVSSNFHFMETP